MVILKILKIVVSLISIFLCFLVIVGLIVRQPTFKKIQYNFSVKCDPQKLKEHVEFFSLVVPPRNHRFEKGLEETRKYIYDVFSKYGNDINIDEWSKNENVFKNISLRIGNSNRRLLVIGAHYDVWGDFPGADDNASGVAGLLELARLFSYHKPKIDVELIAFDAEEPPYMGSDLMGSLIHAKKLKESKREVAGMVCLEMIGYYSKSQPMLYTFMNILYPREGNFIAVVGRYQDREMAKRFKQAINGAGELKVVSYNGPKIIGVDLSDQRNYWNEGYNAVMITDTAFLRNPYYHSEKDLPETLDYAKMANVINGVFSAVLSYEK